MEGKSIDRVVEGHPLAATRRIRYLVYRRGLGLGRQDPGRSLELLLRFDGKSGAAELRLIAGLQSDHERLLAVAAVEGLGADAVRLDEAEVRHELTRGIDVLVLVVHMRDVVKLDALLVRPHVGWDERRTLLVWGGADMGMLGQELSLTVSSLRSSAAHRRFTVRDDLRDSKQAKGTITSRVLGIIITCQITRREERGELSFSALRGGSHPFLGLSDLHVLLCSCVDPP